MDLGVEAPADATADIADAHADTADARSDTDDGRVDTAAGSFDADDAGGDAADAGEAADAADAADAGGAGDATDAATNVRRIVFQYPPDRDLDLLFLVDDSPGMAPLQAKFRARLPEFMNVLTSLPDGPLNLHVAVVSSSLGAGIFGNVVGCQPGTIGNLTGAFQHKATCTALPATEHFIKSVAGVNNFSGDIGDVLGCIANLGEGGCGLEHQFESVRLALQRAQNPNDPDNAGFLRPAAHLAIVMVTNEDDCSVPAESMLFDPNQLTLADPLGGLQSYRCNEFGHKCGPAPGAKPPHRVTTDVTLDPCVSAEDSVLVTVDGFVKFLQSLKPTAPDQVFVAALAGPAKPYVVSSRTFQLASGATEVQPYMLHACTQAVAAGAALESADPSVRISQWLGAFRANALLESICAPDFAPAMVRIAQSVGRAFNGVNCVAGRVLSTLDGTPDCRVVETSHNAAGAPINTDFPFCSAGRPVAPCWEFFEAPQCSDSQGFRICRDGGCTGAAPTDARSVELLCSFAP